MPQNTLAFREVRIEIPPEPPKNSLLSLFSKI